MVVTRGKLRRGNGRGMRFFSWLGRRCEKSAFCRDFGNGVTNGVTEWGYIFSGMGLQKVEIGGWIERG